MRSGVGNSCVCVCVCVCVCLCVCVCVCMRACVSSVQDDIYVFGKAPMCSTPSLKYKKMIRLISEHEPLCQLEIFFFFLFNQAVFHSSMLVSKIWDPDSRLCSWNIDSDLLIC